MDKKREYELLFENWKKFVNELESDQTTEVPTGKRYVDDPELEDEPTSSGNLDKNLWTGVGIGAAAGAAALAAKRRAAKKAAQKSIGQKAGKKGVLQWIKSKGIKGAAGFMFKRVLGPIGIAWTAYDIYNMMTDDKESEEDKKKTVEELKKDPEFVKFLQQLKAEETGGTIPSKVKVKGSQKQRADSLWPLVKQLAGAGGVDPKLVMGIIHTENRFQNLSNNWGSGYMALTSIARKDVRMRGGVNIGNDNKMDPEMNIKAGVSLIKIIERDLKRALRRVPFTVPDSEMTRLILYSYNRGVGAVVDGKGVPIGSPGKGKKYKHAGSKVFERGLKEFDNIKDFINYARIRYKEVLHGDYADRALGFVRSYEPPSSKVS